MIRRTIQVMFLSYTTQGKAVKVLMGHIAIYISVSQNPPILNQHKCGLALTTTN